MRTLVRLTVFLLLASACSQEPYSLDQETMNALDGSLPDSDPVALEERDEPGHAMEGEDLSEPETLTGESLPIAPQVVAALRDRAFAERTEAVDAVSEGLLFSGSTLSLVSNTKSSPQRTTVRLLVTWKTGAKGVCSGTLIRPDAVLTAAHCVYNAARDGFAYAITAIPGAQGSDQPYGKIGAKRSFAPSRYRQLDPAEAKYAFDYGVVRLKSSFSVGTRTLGVGSNAVGRAFVVRGYPIKTDTKYDGKHMYQSRDKIRSVLSNGLFYHRASTLGGMSGSGIDDGSRIVGVHTAGAANDNSGVVFSSATVTTINTWATQAL